MATAFSEATVVVGLLVPLTPLLVGLGAGIAAGVFHPAILVWAMAGAFMGNAASYAVGRLLRVRKLGPLRLPRGGSGLDRAPLPASWPQAVVLCRYLGAPATVAPFLAGWSQVPTRRFLAADLVASLSWPPAMSMIGYAGALGWRAPTPG